MCFRGVDHSCQLILTFGNYSYNVQDFCSIIAILRSHCFVPLENVCMCVSDKERVECLGSGGRLQLWRSPLYIFLALTQPCGVSSVWLVYAGEGSLWDSSKVINHPEL